MKGFKRSLFSLVLLGYLLFLPVCSATVTNETVIVLHGLARTPKSMKRMDASLKAAGYDVHVMRYPTRKKTVELLSADHLAPVVASCQARKPNKIHFVAHSLGTIVTRHYLSVTNLHNLGRIVMLGPPNRGSEVVDKLGHMTLYQWINGPAGSQLGVSTNSLPNTLPVPAADIGVIAGTRSINWILSSMIPGKDDGKVSLENAKIEGMKDFATVPTSHPYIMKNRKVIELTIQFLQNGKFEGVTE